MTDPRVIRFFVDVQNKTKLETNLQAAGQLPSLNNFEARALRVVVSNHAIHYRKTPGPKKDIQSNLNESEILADLIYNSVTTLHRGRENHDRNADLLVSSWRWSKSGIGTVINHGEPDPTATFRFSEPVTSSSRSRTSEWKSCSRETCLEVVAETVGRAEARCGFGSCWTAI